MASNSPYISLTVLPKTWALAKEARDKGIIDCIEFVPDAFLNSWKGIEDLTRIISFFDLPYSFHFTSHSLCSSDFKENEKVQRTAEFLKHFTPILVSDHLSCSRMAHIDLETNIGTIYNSESVKLTVANIRAFKRITGLKDSQFLVEHIPGYYLFKDSELDPYDFLIKVLKQSSSKLILDLHNLYVDEVNRKIDSTKIIEAIPTDAVTEIHLAGGYWIKKSYMDGHNNDLPPRVFEILEMALKKFSPKLINIEREGNFENLENVLSDLKKVRNLCQKKVI